MFKFLLEVSPFTLVSKVFTWSQKKKERPVWCFFQPSCRTSKHWGYCRDPTITLHLKIWSNYSLEENWDLYLTVRTILGERWLTFHCAWHALTWQVRFTPSLWPSLDQKTQQVEGKAAKSLFPLYTHHWMHRDTSVNKGAQISCFSELSKTIFNTGALIRELQVLCWHTVVSFQPRLT